MNKLKKKIIIKLVTSARSFNETHKKSAKQMTYFVLAVIVLLNILFFIPELIWSAFEHIFGMLKKIKVVAIALVLLIMTIAGIAGYKMILRRPQNNRDGENSDKHIENKVAQVSITDTTEEIVQEEEQEVASTDDIIVEEVSAEEVTADESNTNEASSKDIIEENTAKEDINDEEEAKEDSENIKEESKEDSDKNKEESKADNTDNKDVSEKDISTKTETTSEDGQNIGKNESNNDDQNTKKKVLVNNNNSSDTSSSVSDDSDAAKVENNKNASDLSVNDNEATDNSANAKSNAEESESNKNDNSKSDKSVTNQSTKNNSSNNSSNWNSPKTELVSYINKYPETVGWVYIEDTDISYPIMQGDNNEKYLKNGVDGEPANTGAIFLDYRSAADFTDSNSIVYGHNMKDHSMFGKLREYRADPEYYNDHQYFQIITEDKIYRYQIFAYMDVPNDYEIYDYVGKASDSFISDAEPVRIKSYRDSEIKVDETKKVVTLSTCTSQDDLRFVVLGVLADSKDNTANLD